MKWSTNGLVSLVVLLFWSLGAVAAPRTVIVGIVLPLSGSLQEVGHQIDSGLTLAENDVTRHRSGSDPRIQLNVIDDGSASVGKVTSDTRGAIEEGKVQSFVTPCCGVLARAVVAAAARRVPVFFAIDSNEDHSGRSSEKSTYLAPADAKAFWEGGFSELHPKGNQPPAGFAKFFREYREKFDRDPTLAAFIGYQTMMIYAKRNSTKGGERALRWWSQTGRVIPPEIEEIVACGCKCHPNSPLCQYAAGR